MLQNTKTRVTTKVAHMTSKHELGRCKFYPINVQCRDFGDRFVASLLLSKHVAIPL